MAEQGDLARFRANWQGEVDGAALYPTLAEVERQPQLAEVYRRLAATEEAHARVWEQKLREAGQAAPRPTPSWRTRLLCWLARRFGPRFVLPTIASREQADRSSYDAQPDAREAKRPASHPSVRLSGLRPRTLRIGLVVQ